MISIIAACDINRVIGQDSYIPWILPADLAFFKAKTIGHSIVMGRKTYESIGRPLIDRTNIVLTRNHQFRAQNCIIAHTIEEVLSHHVQDEELFIIGGGEIYNIFLPFTQKIYLTLIEEDFSGNKFFPDLPDSQWKIIKKAKGQKDTNNPFDYWHFEYNRI